MINTENMGKSVLKVNYESPVASHLLAMCICLQLWGCKVGFQPKDTRWKTKSLQSTCNKLQVVNLNVLIDLKLFDYGKNVA